MLKPQPTAHGVEFDLGRIAQELRELDAYAREGQTARTLTRSSDLRTVLIVMAAGKTIPRHDAEVSTSVQTLSGHVRLQLPGRSVDLPEGGLLVMAPGLEHDVYAEVDSTLLLTLGWPEQRPEGRAAAAERNADA